MTKSAFFVFLQYSLYFYVNGFVLNSNANSDGCHTPDQKFGLCIEVRKCTQLTHLMQQKPLSSEIANYLKLSHCGFEGLQPKICCAMDTENEVALKPILGTRINDLLPDTDTCGLHQYYMLRGSAHASIKEFPWLVLLEYEKPNGYGFHCGGTLINKRYVLTAANCVKLIPESWNLISVRLGEYNLDTTIDCSDDTPKHCADPPVDITVEEKIVHEQYDPEDHSQSNDIALLRLNRDVTFTEFIRPICLPTSSEHLINGNTDDKMTVAGWGLLGETRSHSNVKLKSRVPLKSHNDCASIYGGIRVDLHGQLCTEEQTSCTVDNGGPLMVHNATSTGFNWYIAGVKSFGPTPCGNNNWPDVYTSVNHYFWWIINHLKS